MIDSAFRHLAKYTMGMDDESHLRAACWNCLFALYMEIKHPEMQDIPARIEKKDSNSKQARKCDGCKHRFLFGDEFPCDECVHRGNGVEDMFVPYDRAEEKE